VTDAKTFDNLLQALGDIPTEQIGVVYCDVHSPSTRRTPPLPCRRIHPDNA
jgi:hypothetical protein